MINRTANDNLTKSIVGVPDPPYNTKNNYCKVLEYFTVPPQ